MIWVIWWWNDGRGLRLRCEIERKYVNVRKLWKLILYIFQRHTQFDFVVAAVISNIQQIYLVLLPTHPKSTGDDETGSCYVCKFYFYLTRAFFPFDSHFNLCYVWFDMKVCGMWRDIAARISLILVDWIVIFSLLWLKLSFFFFTKLTSEWRFQDNT